MRPLNRRPQVAFSLASSSERENSMTNRKHRTRRTPHAYRPLLERLEPRDVPAAPVIDPQANVAPTIPAGKTLFIPITATDPQGEPLTFSVTSSNPGAVTATLEPQSNTFLKISVQGFGDMTFELFGDLTPDTVSRISGLVQSGFYNNLTFHRVEPGFVIQGGDPLGNGTGGPGFTFNDEFNQNAIFSGSGQLALANSGRDTNGSQFFVTLNPEQRQALDFNFTLFGQLVRGFDVLQAIDSVPIHLNADGQTHSPDAPIVITNMSLIQDTHDAVLLLKTTGSGFSTITVTAQNTDGEISAPMQFDATVAPDPVTDPAFLNPVSNQSTTVNTPVSFNVSGTDVNGVQITFNATTTVNGAMVSVVGGNTITVTPPNNFTGPIPVTITASNGVGNPDSQTIIVAVGPRSPTGAAGSAVVGTESQLLSDIQVGSFTDAAAGAAASDYSASINWGDGNVTSGSVVGVGGGVFDILGTNRYAQAGVFPINVTVNLVSSLGGNVLTFKTEGDIQEAALHSQGLGLTGSVGQSFSNVQVATVTDDNPNPIVANFSAMIDWGDGTAATPGVLVRAADGTIQVFASHVYATAGNFTITTTVRDSNSAGQVEDGLTVATSSALIKAPTVQQLNQGFVAALYRTELRREAGTSEIAFWNAAINTGLSQFLVAYDIEISPEHRLLQIGDLYSSILGRAPTLQEQLTALNQLETGGSLKQLKAHLFASAEFFQNKANGDQATLLQLIGIDVLGTTLPTDKQNYYTWVFSTSGSFKREDAVLSFLNSNEALLATTQQAYKDALGRQADTGGAALSLQLLQGGMSEDTLRALLFSSDEGFQRLSAPAQASSIGG
jgi:cyclophilin family peptidyl-prolyl cis-trans isomerase